MTPDRIVITGDVLRPPLGAQDDNIDWMLKVLGPSLSRATGLPVSTLRSDLVADRISDIYSSLGCSFTTENWAAITDADPTDCLLDRLAGLLRGALVLSFECPLILTKSCRKLDVPLIEILVHPIRYYYDLLLCFRPDLPSIHQEMARNRIAYSELIRAAATIRRNLAGQFSPDSRFSVITAQVPWDRSVIHRQRFARLSDFQGDIEALASRSERVFIKPHPDIGVPEELRVWAAQNNTPVVLSNFYEIVSAPQVTEILSLSSSTLEEARAFGVRATRLLPCTYQYCYAEEPAALSQFIPVYRQFTQPAFWSHSLSGFLQTKPCEWNREGVAVALRESRGVSWDWRPDFLRSDDH
ncbi:MAG: hypothetical protein SFV54_26640 [Bryobacteraceae bacterium]|nr:hypothetical protein [Bryobacteraceae bacterium]